ncbi:MAG: hypothetical protein DRR16_05870 [Candidatus Parabeggiatoa sp. nov. 3]|nr:MAG: hypothetical protein DRR00_11405 [Gammaproteobacteria bacterium]RKZ54030.1 MAG: hypothetical protein DRQ99_31475 [Gammaproteobacteria bacterium]RKZ88057.1 MAG: hypothetical protein DRR16_05870 [Gammaproteobacteria bacterium]
MTPGKPKEEAKATLLVEGRCDVDFFSRLCRLWNLNISILPPDQCGQVLGGGVSKMPTILPELLDNLADENQTLQKLGIVADADHTGISGGFSERWKQLTLPLEDAGYVITPPPTQAYEGSVFQNDDGLPDVGLWLLPNHKDDGMLEDLVKQTVREGQQRDLLDKATHCLNELPVQLFEPEGRHHRRSKATIYTWLAWQEKPGRDLRILLDFKKPEKHLIDTNSPEISAFKNWLNRVFT